MEAYALTNIGQMRSVNQDYICPSPKMVGSLPNLFLAADRMGGHKVRDYASRFAMENLVTYIDRVGKGSPVMQLETGAEEVNEKLYEEPLKREELKSMGCTLAAGVVEDRTLYVTNVGDSHLYLIQAGTIRQVTRNRFYVEEMVAMGQVCKGSVDHNSRRNIITRAMGIGRSVELDFFEVDLEGEDYVLLCPDGLSNMVDNDTTCSIAAGPGSLKGKASRLIGEVSRQGGIDNIVVVLVNPLGREAGAY